MLAWLIVSSLISLSFGRDDQKLDRKTKLNNLWYQVRNNTVPMDFYGVEAAELFVEPINLTFSHSGDTMPHQYIGNFYERKKLIHTVGVTATAKLVITNNTAGYTGLFATGCDSAFVRLSMATKPDGSYTPGIAFKCLKDGLRSANFVAMYALDGQTEFNFFEHDFTNHVPALGGWATVALKALDAKFKTGTEWSSMVGLSDFATSDETGAPVTNPNFPYRLVLHPNATLRASYPNQDTGVPFYEELAKRVGPGHLYDFYAQEKPLQRNSELVKIGYIELTSQATTSFFGDRHFFHQHTRMEDDLDFKPEWVADAHQDIKRQTLMDRFRYGDLPF